MNDRPLLATRGLTLTVGERCLCHDLNWQLYPGQCWAILGLNGAGKTSLLHSLAGIRTPDTGSIRLMDKPITDYTRKEIAQRLGLLFQESDSVFPGKVMEHVLLGRHPHVHNWQWESPADHQIAEQALATVGLSEFLDRDIHTLSGGERQRMAIATLLAQQPQIFLLDEPVNHLDWHFQHQLLTTFGEFIQVANAGLVMALHDVNLAMRYCNHVLLMFSNGEVQMGKSSELLSADTLSDLYNYEIECIEQGKRKLFIPA